MNQKFEYVVEETNQPSDKAIHEFHERFYNFMLRSTEDEEKRKSLSVDKE